jgi:hypothetical protein
MPYGNINVDTVTTSTTGGILGAGNASIMKNRIINGAMVIDQRNAGASVNGNGVYTLDRWNAVNSLGTTKYTVQQNAGSVTPPAGFANYLGVTSTSAYTVGATEYFYINQNIEGYNWYDLNWGTANAKTVTLSAWVRSSLTGTFGGSLLNWAGNYSYPFTYSIPVANTWTQISVTIAGPTAGTWAGATNAGALQLYFSLGTGSTYSGAAGSWSANYYGSATGATSVVGTNGATFYITGVQLEVGSSATGFEYRQYGQELALCQRYYYLHASGDNLPISNAAYFSSTVLLGVIQFPVSMRTSATISSTTGTSYYLAGANGGNDLFDSIALNRAGTNGYSFEGGGNVSGTAGHAAIIRTNNASAFVAFSAEL